MSRRDNVLVSRTYYQLGIATLITSIVWMTHGIYQTTQVKVNSAVEVDKSFVEPLNPKIDTEIVEKIINRLSVEISPVEKKIVPEIQLVEEAEPITQVENENVIVEQIQETEQIEE